jgi:hypothetical protein
MPSATAARDASASAVTLGEASIHRRGGRTGAQALAK